MLKNPPPPRERDVKKLVHGQTILILYCYVISFVQDIYLQGSV